MKADKITSTSDSESCMSDSEGSFFNLLKNTKIPINKRFILEYPKSGSKFIDDEAKRNCRYLKFTQDWMFEEISEELKKFERIVFPNLFAVIFDVEDFKKKKHVSAPKRRKVDETQKQSVGNLFDCLSEMNKNRPFIVQWTSVNTDVTKIYCKYENSEKFYNFRVHHNQPSNMENFRNFILSMVNEKMENFVDTMFEALPNVKNFCLIWEFLRTLDLSEEYFNGIILKCAAKGTKNQLLTMLGTTQKDLTRSINENSITNILKLDSHAEGSILSVAVENSNVEVMKYLTEECPHLIQQLPFNHQVEISSSVYKAQNIEFLCDLVEFCDFPFADNFDATIVVHERLQKIIKDRQDFHDFVKTGNHKQVDGMIEKFLNNKLIYSISNQSALSQAVFIGRFNTYHYLKTTYGLEISQNEEDCVQMHISTYAEKLISTDANIQSSIPSDEKVVFSLISKSSVRLTRANKLIYKGYHEKIKKWYQQINEIRFGPALLKVVSSCDKLKIVFDFEHEHTSQIDYILSEKKTLGITFSQYKWIFIGAKNSDDIQNERRIRGTIAHEFCHYAVSLVFKNFLKPYYNSKNNHVQQLYENIIQDMYRWLLDQPKNEKGDFIDQCDNIILCVFTYYGQITANSVPIEIEQELIVRVVEMLAYFQGDEEKISELEAFFLALFDYYEIHVNSEFENFNYENQRVVVEVNEETGILRELKKLMYIGNRQQIELSSSKDLSSILSNNITIVTTNIPKIFLYEIYNNIHPKSPDLFDTENIIVRAEHLTKFDRYERNKILVDFKKVLIKISKLNVFIDCSISTEVNPYLHNYNQNANFIYIVDNPDSFNMLSTKDFLKNATKVEINYSKNDLTPESQYSLLSHEIYTFKASKFSILDFFEQETLPTVEQLVKRNQILTDNLWKLLLKGSLLELNPENRKVELKILFVERNFLRKKWNNSFIEFTFDELLEENEDEKFILIADNTGTGKSCFLEHAGIVIKNKNPTKWVTYVDLKLFIDVFKSEEKKNSLGSKLDFAKFFAEHIISTKFDFEKELFKQMYGIGKVVILFDGFDEIAPDCAEFVSTLAESFDHNESNQLWISTREHFKVDLQKKLNIKMPYKLDEFTKKDGIGLISKIWALNDLKKENCEMNSRNEFLQKFNELDSVNKYREKAQILVEKVPDSTWNSIGLVYLYKILADVGKDNLDSVDEYTEFTIYSKFIDKHYEIWAHEKGKIRKETNTKIQKEDWTFRKFHIYQALQLLAIEFASLYGLENDKDEWSEDEINGGGLMVKKGEKFDFVHRTFAEFFIADFAVQMLDKIWKFKKFEDRDTKFIVEIIQNKKFDVVRMFVDRALAENGRLEKIETATENSTEIAEKVNEIGQNLNKMDLVMGRYKNLVGFDNLTKLVALRYTRRNYEELKLILFSEIQPKINASLGKNKNSKELGEIVGLLAKIAESFLDVDVCQQLINKIKDNYDIDLIKRIFKKKIKYRNEGSLNIIFYIALTLESRTDKFLKFVKNFKNLFTTTEIVNMIGQNINSNQNIFHFSISRISNTKQFKAMWLTFESFFNSCESSLKFRELVMQGDQDEETILHYVAIDWDKIDLHETLWKLLLKTFEHHQDDLWKFLNQISKRNKTNCIQEIIKESNPEIIQFMLKTIKNNFGNEKFTEILEKQDKYGRNLLHYAAYHSSSENFECFINELQELASDDDMKKLLNSLDRQNRNLLQLLAERNESPSSHECLWKCFLKYFDSPEILKVIRHRDDLWGRNVLHYAVRNSTNVVAMFTWLKIKSLMNNSEQSDYLKTKDKYEIDLVEMARSNQHCDNMQDCVENITADYF